jgi:hypothetical protein
MHKIVTEKLNTVLLVVVILLLVWNLWKQPVGRFQGGNEVGELALDTKTGQLCFTMDRSGKIPLCTKLK